MLSVRLLVNSRLLAVKFWERSKVIQGFSPVKGVSASLPVLFKVSYIYFDAQSFPDLAGEGSIKLASMSFGHITIII